MTTMELIERGIGHNCLSDAYDLGRADATKELPTSLYCDGFNDGYAKGRADAIEEIKKLAHEDVTTGNMIIGLVDVEKLKDS